MKIEIKVKVARVSKFKEVAEKAAQQKLGLCKGCDQNQRVIVKLPTLAKVVKIKPEFCAVRVKCGACGEQEVSPVLDDKYNQCPRLVRKLRKIAVSKKG